jgi:hypothetical protein
LSAVAAAFPKLARETRADLLTRPVLAFVTGAQGNQVRVVIVALLAAELLVVDLQVLSGTADLTLPAIAAQDLLPELVVWPGVKPQTTTPRPNPGHEPCWSIRGEKPVFAHQEGI